MYLASVEWGCAPAYIAPGVKDHGTSEVHHGD